MLIEVSRVNPADWIVLKKLRLAALQDSPTAFGSSSADEVDRTDDEWLLRATRASTGNDLATFFALIDQRAIGIVTGYRPPDSPHEVELASMWTSPDVRRSGAGRVLVHAVIDWAGDLPTRSIGLWVMRGNTAAERLYTSMGFRHAVGYRARPSDPCADELRMSMDLVGSETE